jgi:hypothetical protein
MYAGITSLTHEENGDVVTGMVSKEGETIPFEKKVKISDDPTINVWLSKIDD